MVSGGPNHDSPSVVNGRHGLNLKGAVWMTPTVADAANRTFSVNSRGEPKLSAQAKLHPKIGTPRTTPRTAREYDGVSLLGTGGLNPTWVEWLMGFPIEWTGLEDWATPSSRSARSKARSAASKNSKP
jgi:hypothetical protein